MWGWSTARLGDVLEKIVTINPGKTPNDDFQYVDVSSISRQTFSIEEVTTIKGKDAPSRARRQIKTNDVLFATIRPTLQRIALVPENLNNQVCSTGYFVLRPKAGVDSRFLYYFLFTEDFSKEMQKRQKGASYPAVNDSDVRDQKVIFPPLPEQKRIVAILDEAFAGIDRAIANTEKNLTNAREVFNSYLNNAFAQKGDGWEEETLGKIYDVRDGTHDSPKYTPQGHALITSKNLKKHGLGFEKVKYISPQDFEQICRRSAVNVGDILFAMIGTIGNPVVVEVDPDFAIKNVALFKVGESGNSYFLRYYLGSQAVREKMQREAKGTTQKFVGLGYLRNFPIWLPSIEEQDEVVQRLNLLHAQTQSLETIYQQKLDALTELKQSILQKAFNGELTAEKVAA